MISYGFMERGIFSALFLVDFKFQILIMEPRVFHIKINIIT